MLCPSLAALAARAFGHRDMGRLGSSCGREGERRERRAAEQRAPSCYDHRSLTAASSHGGSLRLSPDTMISRRPTLSFSQDREFPHAFVLLLSTTFPGSFFPAPVILAHKSR